MAGSAETSQSSATLEVAPMTVAQIALAMLTALALPAQAQLCDPNAPIPAEPKALKATAAETKRCKEAFDKRMELLASLFPELGLKPPAQATQQPQRGVATAPPQKPPEPMPLANTDAIRGAPYVSSGTTSSGTGSGSASNCFTGPKGGTYTITATGKKNYGGC